MPRSVFTDAHDELRSTLVEKRKAAGLTQVQLAERLKKPQSFVSKFERGERRLDLIEFIAVSEAIGTDPVALLTRLVGRLARPLLI